MHSPVHYARDDARKKINKAWIRDFFGEYI